MSSNAIAKQTKTIGAFLKRPETVEQFRVALEHIAPERFLRVAMTSIQQNEKLLECDLGSLMKALIQSAQVGLEPDGINAHLIPYGKQVKFMADYKGLVNLAYRSGRIDSITSEVVYANDEFIYEHGSNKSLYHVKNLTGDRGERIAVYSIAYFAKGGVDFIVLTPADVALARSCSKADKKGSIWDKHTDAMWKKTALRQHAKMLPMEPDFQRAAVIEEKLDMGMDIPVIEAKTIEKTEDLKAQLQAMGGPSDIDEKAHREMLMSEIQAIGDIDVLKRWAEDNDYRSEGFSAENKDIIKDCYYMRMADLKKQEG